MARSAKDFAARTAEWFAAAGGVQAWQVDGSIPAARIASAWNTVSPPTFGDFPRSLTIAGTVLTPSGQVAVTAPK